MLAGILWSIVTLAGSAAIIISLRIVRIAIHMIYKSPEKHDMLIAIKKRKNTVDFLAASLAIAVSASGEVIKLYLDRNHQVLTAVFFFVVISIIVSSGIIGVICEVGKNRNKISRTKVIWFACCSGFSAYAIGIIVQIIMSQPITSLH